MVSVSGIFGKVSEPHNVRALFIKEIDDRPSTFFFSEFYTAVYAPIDIAKGKILKKKDKFSGLKQKAEEMGVTFEVRNLICTKPAEDVVDYISQREFNVVLFEAMRNVENPGNGLMDRVFDWDTFPSLSIAKHAILNVDSAVGIIVDKVALYNEKIGKVLVVFTGEPYETFALDTVSSLGPNFAITVITNQKDLSESIGNVPNNIEIITVENPIEASIEESKKGYDLMVVGGNRSDLDQSITLFIMTVTPVLVLYPPKVNPSNQSNQIRLIEKGDAVELPV
jgi:hypothetical protein